jgi:hypothetical protein
VIDHAAILPQRRIRFSETVTFNSKSEYLDVVESPPERNGDGPETPIEAFLEQPAYHAEEDSAEIDQTPAPLYDFEGSRWQRFRLRFSHFMFEKEPSEYSSIAPRTPDGKRTKLFFFNGNGRGR